MSSERVDTRPLRTAAQRQTGVVLTGVLGSGAGASLGLVYLSSLSSYDLPVTRVDLLIAVALSVIGGALPSAVAQLTALTRTVRLGERDTTPWRDARDDSGQPLRPPDAAVLEQALNELVDRRADEARLLPDDGALDEPRVAVAARPSRGARSGPSGTSSYPRVGAARSMITPGAERQRTAPPAGSPSADPPEFDAPAAARSAAYAAADGPSSKQPSGFDPYGPYGPWTGAHAADQDERIAREHGPRADRIARATGPRDVRDRPKQHRRREVSGGHDPAAGAVG